MYNINDVKLPGVKLADHEEEHFTNVTIYAADSDVEEPKAETEE